MVTPQRPVHFLYQLDSEAPRYGSSASVRFNGILNGIRVDKETLHLHVRYRTMREEIETRLDSEVRRVLVDSGLHANGNGERKGDDEELVETVRGKLIAALAADASWVQGYIFAGELDLKRVDGLEEEDEKASEMMKVILGRLKEGRQAEDDEWHELIIPVDLPFMHVRLFDSIRFLRLFTWFIVQILCAIEIHILSDVESIYAGQPVSARVEISTSFHWGSVKDQDAVEYSMRYAVQETVTDWLVSGHKRGDFTATVSCSPGIHSTVLTKEWGRMTDPTLSN